MTCTCGHTLEHHAWPMPTECHASNNCRCTNYKGVQTPANQGFWSRLLKKG